MSRRGRTRGRRGTSTPTGTGPTREAASAARDRALGGVARAALAAALVAPVMTWSPPAHAQSVAAPTSVRPAHAAATPSQPRLVDVWARHRPGFDRVVFEFAGGTPASIRARYVHRLVADASGLPVRIAGHAVLRIRFQSTAWTAPSPAPRRRAFALPNVMTAVRAGSFEGVTSYGLGLTQRSAYAIHRQPGRHRVVVDVRAAFPTVTRKVWLFSRTRYLANVEPFVVARSRPVRPGSPASDAVQRLLSGPLPRERDHGLRLLRSGATGVASLVIADGIARVRLAGGCDSGGSTVTVADELMPTLRQFPTVDWVKVYDPRGQTADPTGPSDSIPDCLNP